MELINKYRPDAFEQLLGNQTIVRAVKAAIESDSCPHTFLLVGPSGIGKTTTARIIARHLKASVEEHDAATNTGIDSVRGIIEAAQFRSLTSEKKMLIIDEAHGLSKQAMTSLLKLLEEPPSHLYIALCTTEFNKIPDNIRTRCYTIKYNYLMPNEIHELINTVCYLEKWTLHPSILPVIIANSTGQPRKALTILQCAHTAQSKEEAEALIATAAKETDDVTEFAKLLLTGKFDATSWLKVKEYLKTVELEDLVAYLQGVVLNSSTEASAKQAWKLLDALTFPRASYNSKAQLVACIGALFWA